MDGHRPLPLPGLALAIVAGLGLALTGLDGWLVVAIVLLWSGSLFLSRRDRETAPVPVDAAEVRRDAVREAIEPIGQPLLVVDGDRLVGANAAARTALGGHIVGQDARIALRHPQAMALLTAGDGAAVTIPGFTGGRSLWHLTRRELDRGRWLIELADRSAEADIGRAHTDFVANASHELRTPLASVIGYAETLVDGAETVDAPTRARFLEIVLRESRRMLSLVEDLMTLSLVEAEKHDRPSEQIDLGQLAARVVGEISSLPGRERVNLEADAGVASVLGDPQQLEQLLRNLIDNALKYGDPEAPVQVAVRGAGMKIALSVADEGPGIAAPHLPHLTRRFYRTDPGRSRASGGTGLGLAIVKHIVERHAGQLDIASTPGQGTVATVSIPRADRG